MKKIIAAITIFGMLTGCAQHNWVPGPQVAGDFGAVSGQCKLMAMGAPTGGGFIVATGRPALVGAVVGGAAIIGAVASAVRQQNIYNACLESAGYVAEDRP